MRISTILHETRHTLISTNEWEVSNSTILHAFEHVYVIFSNYKLRGFVNSPILQFYIKSHILYFLRGLFLQRVSSLQFYNSTCFWTYICIFFKLQITRIRKFYNSTILHEIAHTLISTNEWEVSNSTILHAFEHVYVIFLNYKLWGFVSSTILQFYIKLHIL